MKKNIIIASSVVAILMIIMIALYVRYYNQYEEPNIQTSMTPFYFASRIPEYDTRYTINFIDNGKEALIIAKTIVGEKEYNDHKPWNVNYDQKTEAWFIWGSEERSIFNKIFSTKKIKEGGPNIIMKRNGELLAFWHTN